MAAAEAMARSQGLVRRQVTAGDLHCDVLIAGAGIAGLVLALQLARAGVSVTLAEAGGAVPRAGAGEDPFNADLRLQPHIGTRKGRVCGLGGCSVTWGGQLLPLPSGAQWPVPAPELLRYQGTAERMLDVDSLPYDADSFFSAIGERMPADLRHWEGMVPRVSKFVPFRRRNLGALWGAEVAAHPRIRLWLHSRVAELVLSPARDRVLSAVVLTAGGRRANLRARHYVLATGAVECCRVLLESACGSAYGQVGLRFRDHLTVEAATFTGATRQAVLQAFAPWVLPGEDGAVLHSVKMEASRELQGRLGIPAAMVHVAVEEPEGVGAGAVRALLRAQQQGTGKGLLTSSGAKQLLTALPAMGRLAWAAHSTRRRYVSGSARVSLRLNMAQSAANTSRVALSEKTDAGGRRTAAVRWQVSPADRLGLRTLAGHVRGQLAASGLHDGIAWQPALFGSGTEGEDGLVSLVDDARHALGGACMGTDPGTSVVDPDLRVHGVENLSVASTAVFPDGSPQLPTLTLVLLCLRLADRLQREVA